MPRAAAVVLGLSLLGACRGSAQPERDEGDRLLVLYDAFGRGDRPGLSPDWGYSGWIRHRGRTILFDAGWNASTFAANAEALGIDLREIDLAVGSHRHADHLTGFAHFVRVNPGTTIHLPDDFGAGAPAPLPFKPAGPQEAKALGPELTYFGGGAPPARAPGGQFWGARVEYVKESREIAPGIHLIVTRSELMGDFSKYPPHDDSPRLLGMPELSLALDTAEGDVLLTGCSHSSVEAIVRECRRVRGRPIALVAGGFHLSPYGDDAIRATARTLRDLGVARVAPGHCTGHAGFRIFREVFGPDFIYAGLGASIPLPGR